MLDFRKIALTYNGIEVARSPSLVSSLSSSVLRSPFGPSFRHVYKLFGLAYPGDYIKPGEAENSDQGTYVLSYPGVSFLFPLEDSSWSPKIDFVSLLSSTAASSASTMAIYSGTSWKVARSKLYEPSFPRPGSPNGPVTSGDTNADEVDLVRIHPCGSLELVRRTRAPFWINPNKTTPQDLVAELGPPDSIYRKKDRRISIHRLRSGGARRDTRNVGIRDKFDDITDTDQSSAQNTTDESDNEDPNSHEKRSDTTSECFYNYFRYGFDLLVSFPAALPDRSSGRERKLEYNLPGMNHHALLGSTSSLTVTKAFLHGNVPGSYPFNRHRRIRWLLDVHYLPDIDLSVDSEMTFDKISPPLQRLWKDDSRSEEEKMQSQRGMVLNRGWGDSPGSSCELLGGWEESSSGKRKDELGPAADGEQGLGNTQIFGFPGMIFEVLKNGAVSCLTIF